MSHISSTLSRDTTAGNMARLNAAINKFYERNIKINWEERQSALRAWESDVEEILAEVRRIDVRFDVAIHYTGSFYERSKTTSPDEFDLMLELKQLREVQITGNAPVAGFTYVTMTGGALMDWRREKLINDCYRLDAVNIRAVFARHVNEAIRNLNKCRYVTVKTHGPAVTLSITVESVKYDVDLTLAIKLPSWPPIANAWKQRPRRGWPGKELLHAIDSAGCFVVAKQPSNCQSREEILWRYSVSLGEKEIMRGMDSGVANSCRKRVLQVLKYIASNDARLGPANLSSYHMKTVLFWESEKYANDEDWKAEKLGERLLSAISRLLQYAEGNMMPHYFLNQVNLLRDFNAARCDVMKTRLRYIRENAEQYFAM